MAAAASPASEVREILGLVLEQVRSGAEEEINEDAAYGEADNDEDSQDEELAIESAPGLLERSPSRSRYFQTRRALIGARNSPGRSSHWKRQRTSAPRQIDEARREQTSPGSGRQRTAVARRVATLPIAPSGWNG